jgi:hypothetical protein
MVTVDLDGRDLEGGNAELILDKEREIASSTDQIRNHSSFGGNS